MRSAKLGVIFLAVILMSFVVFQPDEKLAVQWLTFEGAIAKNGKTSRKVFIDVYTDWVGVKEWMLLHFRKLR